MISVTGKWKIAFPDFECYMSLLYVRNIVRSVQGNNTIEVNGA